MNETNYRRGFRQFSSLEQATVFGHRVPAGVGNRDGKRSLVGNLGYFHPSGSTYASGCLRRSIYITMGAEFVTAFHILSRTQEATLRATL